MTNADDRLSGALGNDTLFGGLGSDMADYSYLTGAGSGFTATLDAGATVTVTVAAGSDVDKLVSIENIVGGSGNDDLAGDGLSNSINGASGHDTLRGGAGDDVLEGGAGADTLIGGAGSDQLLGGFDFDTVDYAADPSAPTGAPSDPGVALSFNGIMVVVAVSGTDTDVLAGDIENVRGSNVADTLSLRDVPHAFNGINLDGGLGCDILVGRKGLYDTPTGNVDTLNGGLNGSGNFDSYYLVGRAEVGSNMTYDGSKPVPLIQVFEGPDGDGYQDSITVFAGNAYAGDFFTGYFEFAQITEAYDGTNSGFSVPGNAVFVIDTSLGGGYLYLDTDVTSPGYSVIARVLNGAENLTSANLFTVDGNSTPPP
jgi:hypothetical protein